jgi:uncharacterized membrane protein
MDQTTAAILYVVSIIGLLDTLYLSYHALTKTDVACWFFPKEWCQKVQYSSYSKTFGIPNPYLGLLMYVAIILFTYLASQGTAAAWVPQAIVAFGFAFSMYFTYIQAFVLRAFCTWCVVSALNFTIMFLAILGIFS